MKSPYRISAKEPEAEPRFAETRSYAVLVCIALGVIVQLVGLLTHGLDAFGHVAFAFAFGLGTAGLQAVQSSESPQRLQESGGDASPEHQPRRIDAPAEEGEAREDGEESRRNVDDRGAR